MTTFAPACPLRLVRALLLVACAALAPEARALTPAEFFAKVSPSVWLVRTYDQDGLPLATGSAVVIAPETLITNCHVLRKAGTFKVTHEGLALYGKLEMWDPARDVCEVKVSGLDAPAVELGDTSQLVVGQPVYALGSPKGLELTLSNGLVSSLRRDGAQRLAFIQTSAPISHGSSGGGLFDTDARLIGITSAIIEDGQNLSLALPVDYVRELPARHLAALKKTPQPMPVPAPPQPQPPITVTTRTPPAPAPRPAPMPAPLPTPSPAPAPAPAPTPAPAPQDTIVAKAPPGMPAIPFLNEARQQEYWAYFKDAPYPKACAISDNGHFACSGGTHPRDRSQRADPKQRSLERCAQYAGKPCVLYEVDDTVVYRPPAP